MIRTRITHGLKSGDLANLSAREKTQVDGRHEFSASILSIAELESCKSR